jgi:hypothetical protein
MTYVNQPLLLLFHLHPNISSLSLSLSISTALSDHYFHSHFSPTLHISSTLLRNLAFLLLRWSDICCPDSLSRPIAQSASVANLTLLSLSPETPHLTDAAHVARSKRRSSIASERLSQATATKSPQFVQRRRVSDGLQASRPQSGDVLDVRVRQQIADSRHASLRSFCRP